MAEAEKLVMAGAMVPESLLEALKAVAAANERSAAGEIRMALRAHVDSQPKTKQRKPAA